MTLFCVICPISREEQPLRVVKVVQEDWVRSANTKLPAEVLLRLTLPSLWVLGGVILGYLGEQLHHSAGHILTAGLLEWPQLPHHNILLAEDAGPRRVLVTRVRVKLTN